MDADSFSVWFAANNLRSRRCCCCCCVGACDRVASSFYGIICTRTDPTRPRKTDDHHQQAARMSWSNLPIKTGPGQVTVDAMERSMFCFTTDWRSVDSVPRNCHLWSKRSRCACSTTVVYALTSIVVKWCPESIHWVHLKGSKRHTDVKHQ